MSHPAEVNLDTRTNYIYLSHASSSPTRQPVQQQRDINSHMNEGECDDANSPEKRNNVTRADPMGQSLGAYETILETLDDRAGINSTRTRVLEAAIHTNHQISNTGPTFPVGIEEPIDPMIEQTDSPESFKPELFYMISPVALDSFRTFVPAAKLHRLFETLLNLCRPLFLADIEASDQSMAVVNDAAASASLEDNIGQLDTNGRHTWPDCANSSIYVAGDPVESEETVSRIPWGEEQMLDLFNSEPCLEWLETVSFNLAE
ncbi:hypothetical protein BDV36DRAFT_297504 [Aspergillus pseudocaelatus]|uniref:Uncharacterized protein n=1 Tax=Aspergillus pseudocaelatus TaxID=1825620 RepID=A0ABQ6WFS3_9EURO|nr:hypothetical protein BDV36DRAFT_297504 [Aspergillus pseudocaelatus]